jgi:hypothetical protein
VFTTSFSGQRLWDVAGSPVGPVLYTAPLAFGDFSPDGRMLVTTDARIRVWDVTPDLRPVADLERFARLCSSRMIDARGAIVPIRAEEALQLFTDLRARYPQEFAPPPAGAGAPRPAPSSQPARPAETDPAR